MGLLEIVVGGVIFAGVAYFIFKKKGTSSVSGGGQGAGKGPKGNNQSKK